MKSTNATKTPARNPWFSPIICLLLALAVWAVFAQALQFDFVNFDDNRSVYDNPAITRGLTHDSASWAFTHTLNDNWLPLTVLSHMLDCQLYGINPRGHHLTSILIHAATAILLFLMLQNLTGALWRSAFVSAVFAIHPLRVESVVWISERKDVLSGLFFVLTLWAYVCFARRQQTAAKSRAFFLSPFYWLALLLFALGLMSKPMLVSLPLVLLLLDYWPLNRVSSAADSRLAFKQWLALIPEKIPFFLLTAASCVATVLAQKRTTVSVQRLDLLDRLGNAVVSYVIYLRQMFYPAGLAAFYPHPQGHLPVAMIALCALVLLTITAGVLLARHNHPYLLTGWLWYLIMLVPVIGLMQVGSQAHADRYTYLPQIGLYLLLTWGAVQLCHALPSHRVILGCAAAAILAALLWQARVQTTYWQDSVSLWTRVIDSGHENAFALDSLASALSGRGKVPEAIENYEHALQLDPDDAEAHSNLGVALAGQGRLAEAIQHYERALQLRPDYADAQNNLGSALIKLGKIPDAIPHLERATQLRPDLYQPHNNLGNAYLRQDRVAEAIQQYQKALQLQPDSMETLYNLADVLAEEGKRPEAVQLLKRALDVANAHNKTAFAKAIRDRLNSYQSAPPQP